MAFVIAEPCIDLKDRACVAACPADCIHPTKNDPEFLLARQLYIDPAECIDCGCCLPACPVSAIYAEEDLPEQWIDYRQRNADWYAARQPR